MRILLWSHEPGQDDEVSSWFSAAGHVLFRESDPAQLPSSARREQPFLIVLIPGPSDPALIEGVEQLVHHPETRWTPILLLATPASDPELLAQLLDAGASSLITPDEPRSLLPSRLRALERSALQVANLRSARFTDEQTGFYHQTFLLDQLHLLCRKQRRDGIAFCLLLLELRGDEDRVYRAALQLANTVRGADLFGRWEDQLFAVLLPASEEQQARWLADRFERMLGEHDLEARCALVTSHHGTVESEALLEAATNTLDASWSTPGPFLWLWDGREAHAASATPES